MIPKARSRLKTHAEPPPVIPESTARTSPVLSRQFAPSARTRRSENTTPRLFKKYIFHFPLLLLSLPCYWLTQYIVTHYFPEQIADVLVPQVYVPLQLTLFLGNVFFWSFLLLSTRRGILVSLMIGLLLFFKLQHIVFEWWLGVLLIVFVIIEIVLSWWHHQRRALPQL